MPQEPTTLPADIETESRTDVVSTLMQFALAVRHRKNVVFLALVVSALLGALYYATATRYYGASAGIWVLEIGNPGTLAGQDGIRTGLLPTQAKVINGNQVLERAVAQLRRKNCPRDYVDFARTPPDRWASIIQRNLSVGSKREVNIIDVSYESKDPQAAVSVVEAIVNSYLDFTDSTIKGAAGEALNVLTEERKELEGKLTETEGKRNLLRQQCGALGIEGGSKVLHPSWQKVESLNVELNTTQTERTRLQVLWGEMLAALARGEGLQPYVSTVAELVGGDVLRSLLGFDAHEGSLHTRLEQGLIESRAELARLNTAYGPAHPEVQRLQERIYWTEQVLREYPEWVRQRLLHTQNTVLSPILLGIVEHKLNETKQLEATLEQQLNEAYQQASGLIAKANQLDSLDHQVTRYRNLHDILCEQIRNIEANREGQQILAAIVNQPKVNPAPVSPNLPRTILMVLVGGLGVGLGGVYVLNILDDRFRSIEEMQAVLRVPVLAMVRELEPQEGTGVAALQAYVAPNAAESEAFRTLRTALALAQEETNQFVISSPEPGDGKTTVLANLAVAFAQSGKRTLLIDADLRRPRLTAMMGMRGIDGLSSVIRSEQNVVEMITAHIRPSGLEGLDILPSGPRPTNPAELLGSQRFSEILAWAETVYEQVVIDSPPALATSDTALIGRLTNGVLLVVQPAKNRRRMVMRCGESLAVLKIPLLGLVLNRVGSGKDGYYGYSGYYGYEYSYHTEAGGEEDDAEPGEPALAEQPATGQADSKRRRRDEAHTPDGIVPRRAAQHKKTGRSS